MREELYDIVIFKPHLGLKIYIFILSDAITYFYLDICYNVVVCNIIMSYVICCRVLALQPGKTMQEMISFTPKMAGVKMLHASLVLSNIPTVIRGFKTISVKTL